MNVRYGQRGGLDGTLLTSITEFCIGKNEAIVNFLDKITDKPEILFVGDSVRQFEVYRYTSGVPTFTKMSSGELLKTFQSMLRRMFIQLQRELASTAALEEIFKYYASRRIISPSNFAKEHPLVGVPFKNVFAELRKDTAQGVQLPYSQAIFTETSIPHDYNAPVFDGSQIVLSHDTKVLLENLCGGSVYK